MPKLQTLPRTGTDGYFVEENLALGLICLNCASLRQAFGYLSSVIGKTAVLDQNNQIIRLSFWFNAEFNSISLV